MFSFVRKCCPLLEGSRISISSSSLCHQCFLNVLVCGRWRWQKQRLFAKHKHILQMVVVFINAIYHTQAHRENIVCHLARLLKSKSAHGTVFEWLGYFTTSDLIGSVSEIWLTPHVVIRKNQPNIPLFQEVNSVTELIMYFTRFSEGWLGGTGGITNN